MTVAPQDPTALTKQANLSVSIAFVSGLFVLVIASSLLLSALRMRQDDPLRSEHLRALKQELRNDPANEHLKTTIREVDVNLRARYFRHRSQTEFGIYLLLGGVAIFVGTAGRLFGIRRGALWLSTSAKPQPPTVAANARFFVALTGTVMLLALVVAGMGVAPSRLPSTEVAAAKEIIQPDLLPSPEEWQAAWPQFRGPNGNGSVSCTNLPTRWETTEGITWKIPNPAAGYSSPIIWKERILLSGASETEQLVFAIDLKDGKTLWRTAEPFPVPPPKSETVTTANLAAATMAVDGNRVYAFFGSGELMAFSMEGKPAWKRKFGPLKNQYGHAASLAIWRDKLIFQLDQGEPEQALSRLYALQSRTGEIAWQMTRKVGSSWASPLVLEREGKAQIVAAAVPSLFSYAAENGKELWRVDGLNGEVTPSPILAEGMIVAVSPSESVRAVQPDGSGDVSKTKVLWRTEDNVPDITTPASDGTQLFTLTSSGILTCLETRTGKKQWEHDFEMEFHASPVIAAGHVYLFSRKGTAIVVRAGKVFEEQLRTQMDDVFDATPAVVEGAMVVRGEKYLWAIAGAKLQTSNFKLQEDSKLQTSIYRSASTYARGDWGGTP